MNFIFIDGGVMQEKPTEYGADGVPLPTDSPVLLYGGSDHRVGIAGLIHIHTDHEAVIGGGGSGHGLEHRAVFQEEQCGYLAGYAVVKEGFTKLGFTGGGGGTLLAG